MIPAALLAAASLAAAQPSPAPPAAPAPAAAAASTAPAAAPATPPGMSPTGGPALPGTPLEFKSVDGWTLHAVWEKAAEGRPTLVLLHGTGQRKESWRPFALELARAGLGYIAVDLRGHGESRTTPGGDQINYRKLRASKAVNDYEDMTRDAEAAVNLLVSRGVAEETIAVMGAEVGGSVAVKYAAVHPKVPFVIMLSPGLAWQEIPLVNAVRAFKGRATPILMVHSEADKRSAKETPLLYAFAKNAVGERNATLIVEPLERGTRLFRANKDLAARVLAWIADPVQPVPPPAASTAAAAGVSADTATAVPVSDPDADVLEPEPQPADAPAPAGGPAR
jgi:alpha-beta hydrolase superfamily lysophospholipase